MASISDGGMFRQSRNLKSRGKKAEPGISKPLPPPVSSEQVFRNKDMETTVYPDTPSPSANGARNSKEEDRFGFLYSMSEKDYH